MHLIETNPFYSLERLGITPIGNYIDYNAGPITIKLNCDERIIEISTTDDWKDLMPLFIEEAMTVWRFDDNHLIKLNDLRYNIRYNIVMLEKYLTYIITIKKRKKERLRMANCIEVYAFNEG